MRRSVVTGGVRGVAVAVGVALVLGVLGVLGACSHSSGGRSKAGPAFDGAARMPASATGSAAGAAGGSSGGSASGGSASGGSASGGSASGGSASGKTSGGGAAGAAAVRLADGGTKIRTADMTVSVPRGKVPLAADRAEAIAIAAVGEVDADDRSTGPAAAATLQLRVPPVSLPGVLTRLGRLGHEQSRHASTTDVTEKVADVNSRVGSAADAIDQLEKLYKKAVRVSDVIAIEGELNSRQADLESLQAQQRALARQTAMATITLSIVTAQPAAAPPPPRKKHRGGFLGGLQRGWDGFAATAAWIATAIGTVLPFLVLVLALALAARPLRRRLHRPGPAPTG